MDRSLPIFPGLGLQSGSKAILNWYQNTQGNRQYPKGYDFKIPGTLATSRKGHGANKGWVLSKADVAALHYNAERLHTRKVNVAIKAEDLAFAHRLIKAWEIGEIRNATQDAVDQFRDIPNAMRPKLDSFFAVAKGKIKAAFDNI
jgi:hypothetical protein